MNQRAILLGLVILLPCGGLSAADINDYLLPNGEPIVGVYYYSWFNGEPYRHVSWTPEFEYNNRTDDAHIYEVIKAMTDYGINQASYSYWDNGFYLDCMKRHLGHATRLMDEGRPCYFSPYLEPRTIDKAFADAEAQAANIEFISTYLTETAAHPQFCSLGGVPFTNIYVTYYRPDETDEDFRAFLLDKYGDIDALRENWTRRPGYESCVVKMPRAQIEFDQVSLGMAEPGTFAFADRQELRAKRLKEGFGKVISGARERTGFETRYTGDVGGTIVSPTRYMDALTGMSWYNFGYALTNPTRRPKLISEVAKFTDTTFLYTIAPGYVDRQQRWTGGRVESDPFLYPYAWTKAIQALPEGVMILTHSEWFEGSIIDVTKEYGKQQYETTELYSSIFRSAFDSIYREKRDKEPIAIVFNEWATYSLHERGRNLGDVHGLIKLLECLNLEHDVIPESSLTREELEGRKLILAPNCGASLAPGHNELLLNWARETDDALLVVDESAWWTNALGIEFDEDAQKVLGKAVVDAGRGVLFFNGRLGKEFGAAFALSAAEGRTPTRDCGQLLTLLQSRAPKLFETLPPPPAETFEIKSGPVLADGDTLLLPAGSALPWGYIADHRAVGWGLGKGHCAEDTKPWRRVPCEFSVPAADDQPVSEVMALDSDSGRFIDLPFRRLNGRVLFQHPMKFHAVFAIAQSPAKIIAPPMSLSPGQRVGVTLQAVNVTGAAHECALRLRSTPGLSMAPIAFTLNAAGVTDVPVELVADNSYASGDRTIVFELETEGGTAAFRRPLHCTLPACIGTRTTVLGGMSGTKGTRRVTLINVGEAPAGNVRLKLLDGEAEAPDLAPGDEETVEIAFTIPPAARSEKAPDASVSLTLGASKESDGLTTHSGGDGAWRDVEVGGRPATVATRADKNLFIYLWADDAVLPPGDYDLEAEIEYFDQGVGSFMIEYDSVRGDEIEDRYRDSQGVSLLDTGTWKKTVLALPGASLGGRQNGDADLRINGIVPVAKITLRGLAESSRRVRETMTVSFDQFGRGRTQELEVSVISLTQALISRRPEGAPVGAAPVWKLNPYGAAAPGRSDGRPSWPTEGVDQPELRVTNLWEDHALLVVENPHMSVTWDGRRGGLASLLCKATKADYAAFPGPLMPVHAVTLEGETMDATPGRVREVAGNKVLMQPCRMRAGPASLTVDDTWTIARNEPRLTLERHITTDADVELAEFAPVVLRLDPERLSQVLPLGVGFQKKDQPKRGWLETWHSDGWYFVFSGDPNHAGHGLAMSVRADAPGERTGLTRFRYGFFPGGGLALPGAAAGDDELQIRLRGHKRLGAEDGRVHVTVDITLMPGGSYRAARELALLNATPDALRDACTVVGDAWDKLGGVQTMVPTAPTYMFDVRQPYYSAALEGDEQ